MTLVDARQDREVAQRLKDQGCDLNDGMALIVDGRVFRGGDAVVAVNSVTEAGGLLDRVLRALTLTPGLVRVVYPGLKLARIITLTLLGRPHEMYCCTVPPFLRKPCGCDKLGS
jgi:hypothetical protein